MSDKANATMRLFNFKDNEDPPSGYFVIFRGAHEKTPRPAWWSW